MCWWSVGGLAGIVTALELLRAGQRVTLVDRDTPERLGGLALWAFGGMALVGTPLAGPDEDSRLARARLADWLRFGELGEADHWPPAWARVLRGAFAQPRCTTGCWARA
jgi:predicted oxidoreductase